MSHQHQTTGRHVTRDELAALLEQLCRERGAILSATAQGERLPADAEPEDLVQSAICATLQAFPQLHTLREAELYVRAAIRSFAYKERRRVARRVRGLGPMVSVNTSRNASGRGDLVEAEIPSHSEPLADSVCDVGEARDRAAALSEPQRRILLLQAAGYRHRDLAPMLGLTPRQLRRQVAALRAQLAIEKSGGHVSRSRG